MDYRIWNAASMYISSPTGRGRRGNTHLKDLGLIAARRLRHEIGENDISFGKMPVPGQYGYSRDSWFHDYIVVSFNIANDIAALSLALVHEVVHLVIERNELISEELWCRTLQASYFNDLVNSPQWLYQVQAGGTKASVRLTNTSKIYQDYLAESAMVANNELVDWVLYIPEIPDYRDSLTVPWIRRHIDDWGGLQKRWAYTKGLYVGKLAEEGGVENAKVILKILLSISIIPSSPQAQEWKTVVETAGGISALRRGLSSLRRRTASGVVISQGATTHELQQLENLERFWGFAV